MEDSIQWLLDNAYFYLKFRLRTRKEMSHYLCKKASRYAIDESVIEKVLDILEDKRFLDDREFIKLFVEQRALHKSKSMFALTQELLQKGIKKELIEQFFLDNPNNEEKDAYRILSQRWERLLQLPQPIRIQKASQFLLRRGFSYDIVKKTVSKLNSI